MSRPTRSAPSSPSRRLRVSRGRPSRRPAVATAATRACGRAVCLGRHTLRRPALRPSALYSLGLLLAAALLLATAGCALLEEAAGVQRPSVSLETTRIQALDLDRVDLGLGFDVRNPNSVGVRMDRLDYRLELAGRPVAEGERREGLTIAAAGATRAELPLSLRWSELADVYRSLRSGAAPDYRLEMGFWFDVPVLGPVRVPLVQDGRFPRLQRPRVELAGLERTGFTARGVDLALNLRLENPNDFPLDLDRFQGSLSLGGGRLVEVRDGPRLAVPEGGSETWRVPLRVSFLEAGRALEGVLRGGGSLDYELDGSFAFSAPGHEWLDAGVQVPFDERGRVSLGR